MITTEAATSARIPRKIISRPSVPGRLWFIPLALGVIIAHPSLLRAASPGSVLAQHGDPEGLVVHLLGHLLFTAGVIFLLAKMTWHQGKNSGHLPFNYFLVFLICWNIINFSSHYYRLLLAPDVFIYNENGVLTSFSATNFGDLLYYASKFDALFLIAALLCLATALRKWGEIV